MWMRKALNSDMSIHSEEDELTGLRVADFAANAAVACSVTAVACEGTAGILVACSAWVKISPFVK